MNEAYCAYCMELSTPNDRVEPTNFGRGVGIIWLHAGCENSAAKEIEEERRADAYLDDLAERSRGGA